MSSVHVAKSTTSADCVSCKEPIKDVIVQAMNKTWHQKHFICTHCNKPIVSQRYYVYDNKPYCDVDYTKLFLKRCTACGKPIRDVVVMALDQPWHRECFVCANCGAMLSNKGFYESEGRPICEECYESQFCTKCKLCSEPIADVSVIVLGDRYHPECFRCKVCNQPLMDCTFKIVDGCQVCASCDPSCADCDRSCADCDLSCADC
ncbi:paxillin-like [Homalodisca vitripennis]|uniref:paxillin-like n=1 Tax=Homalodisca vitripennis TaxID=197043 RepID=UPI001EEB9402|nr:paxillin-like [Homalodisca vitripennis]KAG8273883.1 Transforming growth factor beta-1-induced transcript 1 protein [Homalodisca vitripennis]